MQCLHPDGIANGTYVFTGKSVGDTVKYTCNVHYQYEAGDLERTCQLGGYWDGIPPVCSGTNNHLVFVLMNFFKHKKMFELLIICTRFAIKFLTTRPIFFKDCLCIL